MRISGVSRRQGKSIQLAPEDKRSTGWTPTAGGQIEIDPAVRADRLGRAGDAAPEDVLGETYVELTRATDPGTPRCRLGRPRGENPPTRRGRPTNPEGGPWASHRPGCDPDRRDLQRARQRDAERIPEVAAGRRDRDQGPQPRPQRRARQSRAVPGRRTNVLACSAGRGPAAGPRSRHRHGLRRPERARRGARRRDHELQQDVRGPRIRGPVAARDLPGLPDVRERDPADPRSGSTISRRTPGRSSELLPVANDIWPTLRAVRELSPNLRSLFIDLDDLIRASEGLPAPRSFLRVAADARQPRPVPGQPERRDQSPRLNYYRSKITDFLTVQPGAGRLAGSRPDDQIPRRPRARRLLPAPSRPASSSATRAQEPLGLSRPPPDEPRQRLPAANPVDSSSRAAPEARDLP